MDFIVYGHRHADYLFEGLPEYANRWQEVKSALYGITDEQIICEFESESRKAKSISQAINRLIKREMRSRGWEDESYIFADDEYREKGKWRLDFACEHLSMEVAFNHRSDIAWNLIKPTLASELNHVEKAIQTSGGIVVAATGAMKAAGGYDNAVGTYEDYVQYLRPLYGMLPAPLAIIGLLPPKTFKIEVIPIPNSDKKMGVVRRFAIEREGKLFCPYCGSELSDEAIACDCGQPITRCSVTESSSDTNQGD